MLQTGLNDILKQSEFDFRKWKSNTSSIYLDLLELYRKANNFFAFLSIDHTIIF